MWAAKPVYHPTCLELVAFVLTGHEKDFYGVTSLEMHLDLQVVACPFEPFPKSMDVWYHYGHFFDN